ncbi:hypothetical protein C469_00715 [Halorubrum lipolyticum DSM 21995]|uniref:Uncharacterized protein n=1 Tax=Halorubrum lipolyticum DSM 21995 TaxID=1227482 RepID=M0P4I8_9EURY|nr:hypothetical protein C469_00715 [Halorubrum lipolyticum DSM 21995]
MFVLNLLEDPPIPSTKLFFDVLIGHDFTVLATVGTSSRQPIVVVSAICFDLIEDVAAALALQRIWVMVRALFPSVETDLAFVGSITARDATCGAIGFWVEKNREF